MSYSSYLTQQEMMERIVRLEFMLGLLIRNTQSGVVQQSLKLGLLDFAEVVDREHAQATLVPGNNPPAVT